jgi:hypothetical protein
MLCDTLASKLMGAGNTLAATLCFICAGNIDKTVEIWSRSLSDEHEGKSYVDLLQVRLKLLFVHVNMYNYNIKLPLTNSTAWQLTILYC